MYNFYINILLFLRFWIAVKHAVPRHYRTVSSCPWSYWNFYGAVNIMIIGLVFYKVLLVPSLIAELMLLMPKILLNFCQLKLQVIILYMNIKKKIKLQSLLIYQTSIILSLILLQNLNLIIIGNYSFILLYSYLFLIFLLIIV